MTPDPTRPPVETPRPVVDERAEVQAFVRAVPRGPRSCPPALTEAVVRALRRTA